MQLVTSVAGLVDLPDGCAATITKALLQFCTKHELDMAKCWIRISHGWKEEWGKQLHLYTVGYAWLALHSTRRTIIVNYILVKIAYTSCSLGLQLC